MQPSNLFLWGTCDTKMSDISTFMLHSQFILYTWRLAYITNSYISPLVLVQCIWQEKNDPCLKNAYAFYENYLSNCFIIPHACKHPTFWVHVVDKIWIACVRKLFLSFIICVVKNCVAQRLYCQQLTMNAITWRVSDDRENEHWVPEYSQTCLK